MTRNQKILAGLVLLVVLLFVWAVAGGGRSSEGDASSPGGIVNTLGDWLGGGADADRADLRADCFDSADAGRLVVKGSCTLTVVPGDADMRRVKLHAENAITVTAPAPRGDSQVSSDLDEGEDVSVAVGPDGADIELDCGTFRTCVLTLPKEE